METIWEIQQPDALQVKALGQALNIDPLAAILLVNRGITAIEAARRHLNPSLADIQPPPRGQGYRNRRPTHRASADRKGKHSRFRRL